MRPLYHFPVLRDLVVDMTPFTDKLHVDSRTQFIRTRSAVTLKWAGTVVDARGFSCFALFQVQALGAETTLA